MVDISVATSDKLQSLYLTATLAIITWSVFRQVQKQFYRQNYFIYQL